MKPGQLPNLGPVEPVRGLDEPVVKIGQGLRVRGWDPGALMAGRIQARSLMVADNRETSTERQPRDREISTERQPKDPETSTERQCRDPETSMTGATRALVADMERILMADRRRTTMEDMLEILTADPRWILMTGTG